jgi:hypothetical protein
MFNGIKLPHRTSTRPVDSQPLLPKGPGQAKGSPSPHAHPELPGRGLPGQSAGAMAPRGNTFLKRSDAMSSQAQAHAYAAYQKPQVHFAGQAQVIEDGQRPWNEPMNFGAKPRPQRISRPSTPPPPMATAPAPAPTPPASPARPQGKHSFFGSLFHRPGSGSPPKRTETSAPTAPAPHLRTQLTPGEKFSQRLTQFMAHCPDQKLKATLGQHIAQGNIGEFKKVAMAAVHSAPDQKSFELLQLMISSINKMNGDYSDVRIRYRKS